MNIQRARKAAQKGFTLIELMIVVAIIGILAAVALPQYQDYTKKAKIGNALVSVDAFKTAVALCIQESGGVPDNCDGGTNGIPAALTASKEVASATVTDGTIVATLGAGLGAGLDGKTITFTPAVVPVRPPSAGPQRPTSLPRTRRLLPIRSPRTTDPQYSC